MGMDGRSPSSLGNRDRPPKGQGAATDGIDVDIDPLLRPKGAWEKERPQEKPPEGQGNEPEGNLRQGVHGLSPLGN